MSYIYKTINNHSDLYHDLKVMGRENFSYHGANALMEYLEQLAGDLGEPIEYDPIAFCCDYAEYADITEYNQAYDTEHESPNDIDGAIVFDGGFIAPQA